MPALEVYYGVFVEKIKSVRNVHVQTGDGKLVQVLHNSKIVYQIAIVLCSWWHRIEIFRVQNL
jgi:hypothetical protein